MVAGFQEPLIPLFELFGKNGTPSPAQIVSVDPKPKAGSLLGLTVMVKSVVVAH